MITLRPYQTDIAERGLAILQAHHILYLACEVRVGKTLIALSIAEQYGSKAPLFVTKKKAIGSIESDDEKLAADYSCKVVNYEQLHNVYAGDHDLIILDEAHCLGQYPVLAKRVKLLKEICRGKPVIYLSGTPSPESYSQLYHQFYVSSWSPFAQWATFYKWAAEFVTLKKKYFFNRQINDYSCADKTAIDRLTAHLFISFTQEQAGFIQPIQEEVIEIVMNERTYKLADYLRKHKVYVGRQGEEILADTSAKLMNKMHQIYSGTVIDENGNGVVFDNTKAKFIKEHFAGRKIGIFYKFRAEWGMILSVFGYDMITDDPEEFATTDKTFVSQIQAGSMGVNLSCADCLVMMNIDFSSMQYWQSRARLQDKNRTKEAKIYWLFAKGGLEHQIYQRVIDKKDFTLSYFKKDLLLISQHEVGRFSTKVDERTTIHGKSAEEVIKKAQMFKALEEYLEGEG